MIFLRKEGNRAAPVQWRIDLSLGYRQGARGWGLLVCLLVLLGCYAGAAAQNMSKRYNISGIVLDENRQPFPLANVKIEKLNIGTVTGDDGTFTFKQLPPGIYSIVISSVGYKTRFETVKLVSFDVTGLRFQLKDDSAVELVGVTIKPKDNPAYRIVRNAIKNKDKNRMDRFGAYEFDSYSKLIIFFDNVKRSELKKPLFRRAASMMLNGGIDTTNIDTTDKVDSMRFKLPLFISEAVTHTVFKAPNKKKETITATRRKSVKDPDVGFLNSLLSYVDVYKNQVSILGKEFVSPVADGAFMNYDYFIKKFERVGENDTIYHIQLYPLRKYDRVFKGTIQIDTRGWALRGVQLDMNTDPLINFVEDIRVKQGFDLQEGQWVLTYSQMEVDLINMFGNEKGATGRSAVYMKNYKLNQPRDDSYFANETVEVDARAETRDSKFWEQAQSVPLESSEKMIYNVMDTLAREPLWKAYNIALEFLLGGTKRWGKFEIGPISRVIGFNPIEGLRPQIGVYTNPFFSTRWKLGTYVAFGTKDGRWKYESDVAYALIPKPRLEVGLTSSFDVEQSGFKNFMLEGQGLVNSVLQRIPWRTLNYFERYQARISWDVANGLTASFFVSSKHFNPAFDIRFRDVQNAPVGDVTQAPLFSTYQTTELRTLFRISFREPYVLKGGEKVYLYTHFPVFYVEGAWGIRGFLGGHFNYQSLTVTMTNFYKLGRFGKLRIMAQAGQIFGTLPYFSLQVFRGSQSLGIEPIGRVSDVTGSLVGRINRTGFAPQLAFNNMFFNEFIADQYVMGGFDWRLEGWLFNKIPLFRKLQWKEIITGRLAWGRLSDANRTINFDQGELIVKAPDTVPYAELGGGIENIFRIFQVHFITRLSNFNPPAPGPLNEINRYPALFNYNFGIRFGARLGL